jgi:hypothetical protein
MNKPQKKIKTLKHRLYKFEIIGLEDVKFLIARIEQLEKAIESACYRHHIECDKKCVPICPVKIGKDAISTGPKPE